MTYRRRTFPEVLNNLLTSITRGVTAEAHPFPPVGSTSPPYSHHLLKPTVRVIDSVYGSRFNSPHEFRNGTDYRLSSDKLALEWLYGSDNPSAEIPDMGTLIQVNYHPDSAAPDLTDIYTGSVVRTLAESVALEIASLYAQLEVVYQSGFIDTATGTSLDNVVALLGVERIRGRNPVGEVEFTRSASSRGAISIPSGTRVMSEDGSVEYRTTASVTLAPGQNVIRVPARDQEVNDRVDADTLTVLPVPIAGITSVTNPSPTAIAAQDETDAELRTRAKEFLYGSERSTLGALNNAVRRQGLTADVEEVSGQPGYVEITPHAENIEPEQMQRLLAAIEAVRPAGVLVTTNTREVPKKVRLELRITTVSGILEQDIRAAHETVREKISDYFDRLPARSAGSINRIVGLVLSASEIEDVRILSATWDGSPTDVLDRETGQLNIQGSPTVLEELHIANPGLPTLLRVVVTYPQGQTVPDSQAIEDALAETVTYLNELNNQELPNDPVEVARRTLSYGKLLLALPLPNQPATSLEDFDSAVTPPTLPDETTIAPYGVQFTFTIESGLTRILTQAADEDYTLTPFERLSPSGVELSTEAGGA